MRVSVVQPQGGVQPDGHPHAIADPCQLTHLALPARVSVEGLLRGGEGGQQQLVTTASHESRGGGRVTHLNLHALWLDDVDLVLVAAPDFVVDHGHAADGVVRTAQVHQVVV